MGGRRNGRRKNGVSECWYLTWWEIQKGFRARFQHLLERGAIGGMIAWLGAEFVCWWVIVGNLVLLPCRNVITLIWIKVRSDLVLVGPGSHDVTRQLSIVESSVVITETPYQVLCTFLIACGWRNGSLRIQPRIVGHHPVGRCAQLWNEPYLRNSTVSYWYWHY